MVTSLDFGRDTGRRVLQMIYRNLQINSHFLQINEHVSTNQLQSQIHLLYPDPLKTPLFLDRRH
jgi:hypothetical protein